MQLESSFNRGILKYNPKSMKVDVPNHHTFFRSKLTVDDAADILEMANIAILRSKSKKRKAAKSSTRFKTNMASPEFEKP